MEDHLELFAHDIADGMVKQEKVDSVKAFDPATILAIIQIITFIINLFKKKNNTPEGVQAAAKKSNLIQRALIKGRLKKYMRDNSDHYETYEKYKDSALKTALNKIGTLETSKLQKVMSSVPSVQAKYLD